MTVPQVCVFGNLRRETTVPPSVNTRLDADPFLGHYLYKTTLMMIIIMEV